MVARSFTVLFSVKKTAIKTKEVFSVTSLLCLTSGTPHVLRISAKCVLSFLFVCFFNQNFIMELFFNRLYITIYRYRSITGQNPKSESECEIRMYWKSN